MFTSKHKAFFCLSIYAILVLHVYILFPHLSLFGQLLQAFLRLIILATAVVSTHFLLKIKPNDKLVILKWLFWLMIIPYPIYNIFQVRHIAEIFNLQPGEHFAPGINVNYIWKCLPTLAYAFISGLIGFCCIYTIAEKYFRSIYKQLLFSTIILIISLAATIYGLHSRLDTYHIFTHTITVFKDFIFVFSNQHALINYFSCTGFIIFCFGLYWSFLRFILFKNYLKILP